MDTNLKDLPQDRDSLEALLRKLMVERDQQQVEILRQSKRADELYLQNLRLQQELERYKKWYYGPRGDQLHSSADIAQALLEFAQPLESKPVHSEDVPKDAPEYEVRRVRRRKGRRNLANFENLPVTTHVHELHGEERKCPCCGIERPEIGEEETWQIEYIPGRFERIRHVQKEVCLSGVRESGGKSADGSGG